MLINEDRKIRNKLPIYKQAFLSQLEFTFDKELVRFKDNKGLFKKNEPELFDVWIGSIKRFKKEVGVQRLTESMYNQIISRIPILTNQIEDGAFVEEPNPRNTIVSVMNEVLKVKDNYPLEILPDIGLLLVLQRINVEIEMKLKDKTVSSEDKNNLLLSLDHIRRLGNVSANTLRWKFMPKKGEDVVKLDWSKAGVKSTFYDTSKGTFLSQKFFIDGDRNQPKNIGLMGNRGTGKTIGLMNIMFNGLNDGFKIINVGFDKRDEFRFASLAMRSEIDRKYYELMKKQGREPFGLPVKIFSDDPKLPVEEKLEIEWIQGNERDKHTGKFKKFPKANIDWGKHRVIVVDTEEHQSAVLQSLREWRRYNRGVKLMIVGNELHKLAGSTVKNRKSYGDSAESVGFFEDVRGFGMPLISNTQGVKKLVEDATEFHEVFVSWTSSKKQREAIADLMNLPSLKHKLQDYDLFRNKEFLHITPGKILRKVKFLLPPWMYEDNTKDIKDVFKKYYKK